MDALSYAVALEEIARACASTAVAMSVQSSLVAGAHPERGDRRPARALAARYRRPVERSAASRCPSPRPAAMPRPARRHARGGTVGDQGAELDHERPGRRRLRAVASERQERPGITAFILPMGSPGRRCGPPDEKLGIRGWGARRSTSTSAPPRDAVLGEVGRGFEVAMSDARRRPDRHRRTGARHRARRVRGRARLRAAAAAMGKPIIQHQAIAFELADMGPRSMRRAAHACARR